MNIMEFVEGGGLLIICIVILVFAVTKSRATSESWPKGILSTNALVLIIIATGFFGIAAFIDSFLV